MPECLQRYKWTNEDASEFSDFLLPMLEYDPRRRATAEECLEHPWLRRRPQQQPPTPAQSGAAAGAAESDNHAVAQLTSVDLKSSDVDGTTLIPTNQAVVTSA